MSMPGLPELIIILAVVFLLFGANKLPKLGGAIGESIKNFKKGIKDNEAENLEQAKQDSTDNEKRS
ncbi:MAG: twin-arginine translocase TatA/TatE family subunit [Oligoflexales bacterium]